MLWKYSFLFKYDMLRLMRYIVRSTQADLETERLWLRRTESWKSDDSFSFWCLEIVRWWEFIAYTVILNANLWHFHRRIIIQILHYIHFLLEGFLLFSYKWTHKEAGIYQTRQLIVKYYSLTPIFSHRSCISQPPFCCYGCIIHFFFSNFFLSSSLFAVYHWR